nr:hypothetical protein [Bacillota bacterium]
MSKRMAVVFITIAVLVLCAEVRAVWPVDWGQCAQALRDVSWAAEEAAQAAEEADDAKRDLELCVSSPGLYDPLGTGCSLEASRYQNAVWSFQDAIQQLEMELRSLQWSCQ